MDEQEFQRLLDLFPVVRPRDYHIELDRSRSQSSESKVVKQQQDAWEQQGDREEVEKNPTVDVHDVFWEKLKIAAEEKVGAEEARRFCQAFKSVHKKLVYEELSLDAARRVTGLSQSSWE